METMLSYLWQSAMVLTLLFVPFQLLLRKEHYFALNRIILLSILILSMVLPLCHHSLFQPLLFMNDGNVAKGMFEVGRLSVANVSDVPENALWQHVSWQSLLIGFWLCGSLYFVVRQIWNMTRLYAMLKGKGTIRETLEDGSTLYLSSSDIPSFSWMRTIVMSYEEYEENGDTILAHERAHIAHHHSLDKLLMTAALSLQWWNPFAWLLSDALTQVHEYEADLAVIKKGINATQYQLLLIRKAAGPAGLALVNGFKCNKLKLRIVMMNNMINLRGAKSRYLALLPMLALAIACTSEPKESVSAEEAAAIVETEESATWNQATRTLPAEQQGEVFTVCEEMPTYPGGEMEMMKYLQKSLRYPAVCVEAKIEGRVMVSFVVEKDGSISSCEVLRSPDDRLSEEAVRVIQSMPSWNPGQQRGQAVRVKYVLPVTFRLQ